MPKAYSTRKNVSNSLYFDGTNKESPLYFIQKNNKYTAQVINCIKNTIVIKKPEGSLSSLEYDWRILLKVFL